MTEYCHLHPFAILVRLHSAFLPRSICWAYLDGGGIMALKCVELKSPLCLCKYGYLQKSIGCNLQWQKILTLWLLLQGSCIMVVAKRSLWLVENKPFINLLGIHHFWCFLLNRNCWPFFQQILECLRWLDHVAEHSLDASMAERPGTCPWSYRGVCPWRRSAKSLEWFEYCFGKNHIFMTLRRIHRY